MNTKNTTNNRTSSKTNNKHSNGRNNKFRKTQQSDSPTFPKSNAKHEYGEFKDGRYVSGPNSTSVINPIEQERQQKFSTLPKPVDVQIAPEQPNTLHRNPSPPGLLSPSHFSNPQLNNPRATLNNPPSTVRAAPSAPQIYVAIDPQSLFTPQFQFATSPSKPIAAPVSVNTNSSNSVQAVSPTKSPTRSYSIQGSPGLHFAGGSYTNAPDPRMVAMPTFSMVPS